MKKQLNEARPRAKGRIGRKADEGRIWVGSLSAYNDGRIEGEWFDLPMDEGDLEYAIEDLEGEEYFIADYELPFHVGEYDDPLAINRVMELADENDIPGPVLDAVIDHVGGIRYLLDDPDKLEDVRWMEGIRTQQDLAIEVVDQMGGPSELGEKTLEMYFDYEAFGRDLEINGDYTILDKGYAIERID